MSRGRLIFPQLAEIYRLDTTATAADPDGAGPLVSGYDPDFLEPVQIPGGSQAGTDARREIAAPYIPCQVEVEAFEALQQVASGNAPNTQVRIVFHFYDLERLGLVDASTGLAKIHAGDRLHAIRRISNESIIQMIRNPPGLYAVDAQPRSFGLSSGERNLLVVTFQPRAQGVT